MSDNEEVDTREFDKIDGVMPSLLQRDLITDIECRMVVSCNELAEKKAALYTIIMSKTTEDIVKLTEEIKTLTENVQTDESKKIVNSVDCNVQEEDNAPLEKMMPLLNNAVLACLFGFLSLDEIKDSRFVCRQWNSTAEIYLRKRSAICFRRKGLQLRMFMEVSKYSLPNLPFSAYHFSDIDFLDVLSMATLENFFDTFGNKIKEITFENVKFLSTGGSHSKYYDITPLIAKMSNLSILKIKCQKRAEIGISIENLVSLKTFFLENCIVVVNSENHIRLAPSNARLTNVQIQKLGQIITQYNFNDFFDISVVTHISTKGDDEVVWRNVIQNIWNSMWKDCDFAQMDLN